MEKTERKFLAIAAHADDFELFASSVCQLGAVTVCVVAKPDKGRKEELEKASEVLGYCSACVNSRDGYVEDSDIRGVVASLLDNLVPDILLTHDPWKRYQLHPDHRSVGFQTIAAITHQRLRNAYIPEELWLWNTDLVNHTVRADLALKQQAIRCYESQSFLFIKPVIEIEGFHRIFLDEEFG